jgi:DNA invertase Pin-like site-specific DNA recombinase
MEKYVVYYRVSTQKQGISGLGIIAQENAVKNFLRPTDEVLNIFKEVESGKKDNRPKLAVAIQTARLKNATLLIAKIDRLARSVRFITELQESKVKFVACDCPEANDTMVQMLAVMSQWEAQQISNRTKLALAEARRRGVKLGNPQNLITTTEDRLKGTQAAKENANEFAKLMYPMIEDIKEQGLITLRAIARELNQRQFKTARKSTWTPTGVKNLLARIETCST